MHMPHGSGCMPTSMDRIHCSLLGAHAPVPSLILSLSSLSDFPSRTVSLARSLILYTSLSLSCSLFLSLWAASSLFEDYLLNTVCEPVEEVP